ncbi:Hypothetical protein NTJ_09239 [Nesidiocoris tenuis]|uniref:Uncharacterized protein n=1 Tax=Nesidiocoris tenuis TaxID=355587 RepID=A0ABN7AWU2_9HEMI|nr:Hypothetical protein NTJ_09239 [Nesidiocoris tenuis]
MRFPFHTNGLDAVSTLGNSTFAAGGRLLVGAWGWCGERGARVGAMKSIVEGSSEQQQQQQDHHGRSPSVGSDDQTRQPTRIRPGFGLRILP